MKFIEAVSTLYAEDPLFMIPGCAFESFFCALPASGPSVSRT